MTAKTEMKNFIDHYGLDETLEALDDWIQERSREEKLKNVQKEDIRTFVEQQVWLFDWDI